MTYSPSVQFGSDAAILAGSLAWRKEEDGSRTTAQFTLSLTLALSFFPNATQGGTVLLNGGVLEFGDRETEEQPLDMEVLVLCIYTCVH